MFKKIWRFIWHDDSLLSWIVNIALAFVIVKFLIYPGLGLIFNTQLPVVAVVSCSMQHDFTNCGEKKEVALCKETLSENKKINFDEYWSYCGSWYEEIDIEKKEFESFPMKNGFNKGDIMFLYGTKNIREGDVIVFKGNSENPIIHRVVKVNENSYQTKGDHNPDSFAQLSETNINPSDVLGKAFLRIPYLGWIKIGFTDLINIFRR